ncbi:MAG: hypothetical protein ACOYOB_08690 [Myxococcota bacterium]
MLVTNPILTQVGLSPATIWGRWVAVAVWVGMLAVWGCGGDPSPAVGDTAVEDVVADTDGDDTALPDILEDVAETADTTPAPDVDPQCPVEGEAGCPCSSVAQCNSGFCIETPVGQECGALCGGQACPEGEKCIAASGSGGEAINVCVSSAARLCNPCGGNADCQSLGHADARCVDTGDTGAFCGTGCATGADCAKGYSCKDVKDVGGADVKQCVPDSGVCSCSASAMDQGLSTACFAVAGTSKCAGKRTCIAAGVPGAPSGGGLTGCVGATAIAEKCDAIDNDCDGQTDEATCDDNNPCTDDKCQGGAGCQNLNNQATCDKDGSICTQNDTCQNGKCVAGKLLKCDDGNACTKDVCDPKDGCKFSNADSQPCNADDNPCTINDVCKEGACAPGPLKACATDDSCTVGKCAPETGKCSYAYQDGLPCNDGNPCTQAETCKDTDCKGTNVTCDDGTSCTADSCDPKTGCVHAPVSGVCDDKDKCTTGDTCASGVCKGAPIDVAAKCDDGNDCTKDWCDPPVGCTTTDLTGPACDDGSPCTAGDACKAGECTSDINTCGCAGDSDCISKEDGNLCNGTFYCDTAGLPFVCKVKASTIVKCDESLNGECQSNVCDPSTGKCGLQKKPDGLDCDADGSLCTAGDSCKDGKCIPGAVQVCNDKNACTNDSCDPKAGCIFAPNVDPCDADQNPCTESDACALGTCVPGKVKPCASEDQCVEGKCTIETGKCSYLFKDGAPCNDGSPCTIGDLCKNDLCLGEAANCDDGNACTGDSCNPESGCVHVVVEGVCSDDDACTTKDACANGKCIGLPMDVTSACEDDNVCTADSCAPETGCVHKPTAGSCDDGSICTVGDACAEGVCVSGTNACGCTSDKDCVAQEDGNKCNGTLYCDKSKLPYQCKIASLTIVTCDDSINGQCQTNACNPATGLCTLQKQPDGQPCDADSSVCTAQDACKDGSCVPGAVQACDDQNPCTDDICDPSSGCKYTANTAPCDGDQNACTANDTCALGTCVVGKIKVCADGDACTQDVCEQKTGLCKYLPLQKSCSDDSLCTTGDQCGIHPDTGNYTCVGKAVKCDDSNPCTVDTCDAVKGCVFTIDATLAVTCYTGSVATKGKGLCKDGTQQCGLDGKLGVCKGEVLPAPVELCDNQDNDCDGSKDEGCAPSGFSARFGTVSVSGDGVKYGADVLVGGSAAGGGTGGAGKYNATLGFFAWFKAFLGL